jgi:hypothetical protein
MVLAWQESCGRFFSSYYWRRERRHGWFSCRLGRRVRPSSS